MGDAARNSEASPKAEKQNVEVLQNLYDEAIKLRLEIASNYYKDGKRG